jgi:predicted O-methyltransferase YrrM
MRNKYAYLTPRYVKDRLRLIWYQRCNPTAPWLTQDAIKFLGQVIQPSDRGIEFGSGRSTLWLAHRMSHLTSVESSHYWFTHTKRSLEQEGLLEKVDYRLAETPGAYVNQADDFGNESLDFCLIDGDDRDSLAMKLLPKMKNGALFVIDNINWYIPNDSTVSPSSRRSWEGCANSSWQDFLAAVSGWRRYWTSNGVFDTCIWVKPCT